MSPAERGAFSLGGIKDPRVDAIMAKVGGPSVLDRVMSAASAPAAWTRSALDRIVFETLDRGLPLRKMVEQIDPDIAETANPYVAWRLLAGDSAIIEDWLGINGLSTAGTVPFKLEDRLKQKWGPSLVEILQPVFQADAIVGEDASGRTVRTPAIKAFEAYLIARRANELMQAGKENLYTQEEIDQGLSLETPLFKRVAEQVYAYNDALLQYAVDGGYLSEEAAARMRAFTNYIPFFREAEHEGDVGGRRPGVFKRMTGGTRHLKSPLENLIDNTASIIHAVNRNAVLVKALEFAESHPDGAQWLEQVPLPKEIVRLPTERIAQALKREGVAVDMEAAREIALMQTFFHNKPIGDEKKRIVIIKLNGKPAAVRVNDTMLWRALYSFAPIDLGFLVDIGSIPAELLKTGVVLSPEFMAANMTRDTVSGWVQSKGHTVVPFLTTMAGYKDIATGSEIHKLYRALGGAWADLWHGDVKETRTRLGRLAKVGGFHPGTLINPASWWRGLRKVGATTETGTRLRAFQHVFDAGGQTPDAALRGALEGREVAVDFSLHGASKSLRILERMTPFLNPAKQGIYKAGRTFREQGLTTTLRGLPLVALTFALWWHNRDEDWYKRIEDWEKNYYWHFDLGARTDDGEVIPFRMPKPFEYGAIFGSFWEPAFEKAAGDITTREAMERTASIINDVFLLRMAPLVLTVPIELWANKSLFTDRPIVPEGMQGIDPRFQYGPGTSAFARVMGEKIGLSPYKIDHTVRSLTGYLGTYAVMGMEHPLEKLNDLPSRPAKPWWQTPIVRRFLHDPTSANTRQMREFYDLLQEMRMQQATLSYLNFDREYLDSLDDKSLFARQGAEMAAKTMSTIRKANRNIRERHDLTPEQKRELIAQNNKMLKAIAERQVEAIKSIKENTANASQ